MMKKILSILLIVLSLPIMAEDASVSEQIFGFGNISQAWVKMSTAQKCFAVVAIPPGYVVGICCKSIAWLFMGQRDF